MTGSVNDLVETIVLTLQKRIERERSLLDMDPLDTGALEESLGRSSCLLSRLAELLQEDPRKGRMPEDLARRWRELRQLRAENMVLLQKKMEDTGAELRLLRQGRKAASAYTPTLPEAVFIETRS